MMRESTELQNWRWDKRLPEYGAVSEKRGLHVQVCKIWTCKPFSLIRFRLWISELPPELLLLPEAELPPELPWLPEAASLQEPV